MEDPSGDRALGELADVLWHEHQLLDLLHFKLEEEQLVLVSGHAQWLDKATREVEVVLTEIRQLESRREAVVARVGEEVGLGPAPSLREIIEVVPTEWAQRLSAHRDAFCRTTQKVAEVTRTNRELLNRGAAAARQALVLLGDEPEPEVYAAPGRARAHCRSGRLIDGAL